MKKTFLRTALLLFSIVAVSQQNENLNLLKADSTWTKEIFQFPIHFAPEIDFEGFEDARFPAGWGKPDSPFFWSYVFAWKFNRTTNLTENELQTYLQYYFDGLMNVVNKDKTIVPPGTIAVIRKSEDAKSETTFEGKVTIYDAFRTKKELQLNVLINQDLCEETLQSIVVFRFSPAEFESGVWQTLNGITLSPDNCDL
ncbi:hypothetical protein ATE92_2326 [Ulvibacter sp. MAR_2010_11]|uniref:hypothetical protein n=1 Tax=Ulvibacter sp. MAR_2010_11 TaxID=1250229 RepID=UPI000C2C66FE|nr:hypothetical protein [Ulvibacter sp. MAR_2010_11]PKA84156.1 hypothetical protein ATE92_2326 [Ulvibacter sp. MAR_2010_11]